MSLNRREVVAYGAGVVALSALPASVFAASDKSMAAIAEFTGGAEVGSGVLTLDAPEIAENGNTVPIGVNVDMDGDVYPEAVMILADGNPSPGVATFMFTPNSGEATASTRIRLAKTQDVIAVAKMSDGSFAQDTKTVKVTIGGCGG